MDLSCSETGAFARAAHLLCERWTPLLVRALLGGGMRFNQLHRSVPGISSSLLAQRLRRLEAIGVVRRTACGKVWEYALTEAGAELEPIIDALDQWGARWAARVVADRQAARQHNVSLQSQ